MAKWQPRILGLLWQRIKAFPLLAGIPSGLSNHLWVALSHVSSRCYRYITTLLADCTTWLFCSPVSMANYAMDSTYIWSIYFRSICSLGLLTTVLWTTGKLEGKVQYGEFGNSCWWQLVYCNFAMHYFSIIIIGRWLAMFHRGSLLAMGYRWNRDLDAMYKMFPTSGGWWIYLASQPTSAHWLARKARLMSLPATHYMQEASMLAAYFQDCCAQKMLQRYMASMP